MAKLDEKNIIYDGTKIVSIDGVDVYTSNEVDNKLVVKANKDQVYDKLEIDKKLQDKASISDLSNFASKAELKNKVDDIVIGNLGNTGFKHNNSVEDVLIEIKNELDKKQSRNDSGNIKNEVSKVNTLIGNIRQTGFSGNTVSEQLREAKVLLDGNRFTRSNSIDLSNYYTKDETYSRSEVDQRIAHVATGGSVDLSNYATKQELTSKADSADLDAKLDKNIYDSEKANFASKSELSSKAESSDISRIDSKISSIEGNISTKADNTDYQSTKRSLTVLESKVGNLSGTGLNGSTVTELLTDVKTKIDGIQAGGGQVDLSDYYNKSQTYSKTEVDDAIRTKVEDSEYQTTKNKSIANESAINSIKTQLGDLQGTGLTGSTVTELLTDVKTKIDSVQAGSGSPAPTVDMASIKESIFAGKIEVFKRGERIDGLDPVFYAENGPYFRIPSVEITDNGTIYVVTDCRDKPTDQVRICIVAARSIDGGKTFEKKIIMNRDLTAPGHDETVSRVMDPTTIYTGGDSIFVLAGRWVQGGNNWGGGDTKDNWTAAATCIISDANWQSGDFQVDYNFKPTTNAPANLGGFLGGVDRGLVSSSGKWVMPVQFVDNSGCKATIMYKEPSGDWQWATNFTTNTNSGECSIIEVEPDVFELILRKSGGKKRYRIENYGATAFQELSSPAIPGDTNDQGSFIHFKTKSGAIIDLITNAQNETGRDFVRDQITLYHFDRLAQPQSINAVRVFEYEKAGAPTNSSGGNFQGTQFGGYSSLCYKYNPNKDGEMLLVVVEDDVGVSMFDATDLLAGLENVYFSHSSLSIDEVSELKKIPHQTSLSTSQAPEKFDSFINMNRINSDNTIDMIGSDGTVRGKLTISGTYLDSSGRIDPSTFSPSDIVRGGIHLNNGSTVASLKGNCSIDSSATTISYAFSLYIPTQSGQGRYTPIVRFLRVLEGKMPPTDIYGGLEIHTDGNIYITKANNESIPANQAIATYSYDTFYNVVVEISGTTAKLFLNGDLAGTATLPASYFNYLKTAPFICVGNPGDANKRIEMHIGCISIYSRVLTDEEKRFVNEINGLNIGNNSFRRINELAVTKADKTELDELKNNNSNERISLAINYLDKFFSDTVDRFKYTDGIDATTERVWKSLYSRKGFNWTQSSSQTITKESDGLKIVSTTYDNADRLPRYLIGDELIEATGFSLSFNFKIDATLISGASGWPSILGVLTSDVQVSLLSLGITNSTTNSSGNLQLNMHYRDTPSTNIRHKENTEFATSLPNGQFNNVTVVWNGTQLKFYGNGTHIHDLNVQINDFSIIKSIVLGNCPNFGGNSNITFSDVTIYSKALSQEEITDLHNGGRPAWYNDIATKLQQLETKQTEIDGRVTTLESRP